MLMTIEERRNGSWVASMERNGCGNNIEDGCGSGDGNAPRVRGRPAQSVLFSWAVAESSSGRITVVGSRMGRCGQVHDENVREGSVTEEKHVEDNVRETDDAMVLSSQR